MTNHTLTNQISQSAQLNKQSWPKRARLFLYLTRWNLNQCIHSFLQNNIFDLTVHLEVTM